MTPLRLLRSNPRRAIAAAAAVIAALGTLAGLGASGALAQAAAPRVGHAPKGETAAVTLVGRSVAGTVTADGTDDAAATGLTAPFGTPTIDGEADPIWDSAPPIQYSGSGSAISATDQFMWDSNYLYVLVTVNDSTPVAPATTTGYPGNAGLGGLDDGVDVWINWTNSPDASYTNTSGAVGSHYNFSRNGVVSTNYPDLSGSGSLCPTGGDSCGPGGIGEPSTVKADVVSTSTGYTVEAGIPWPSGTRPGDPIGIATSVNDFTVSGGARTSYITTDNTTEYWNTPVGMPTLTLTGGDNNGQIFGSDNPVDAQVSRTAYVPTWPQLVSAGSVSYSSADPSVASVSSDGVVTGVSAGTTTITATSSGLPDEQVTVNVTFPPGPYGFTERVFAGAGSGLVHPAGLAVDASGDVWTTDAARDDVEEFSPQGSLLLAFGRPGSGNGELSDPEAIAVSGGDVYVADTGNSRVEKFTTKGTYVQTIGGPGTGNGQFTDPRGVAVDTSGNIWVADTLGSRVEEFTPAGSYVKSITAGLSKPQGISFDSSGDLWVADSMAQEYIPSLPEGLYPSVGWAGNGQLGGVTDPEDVAANNQGQIVVTDPAYDVVEVFGVGVLDLPGSCCDVPGYEGDLGLPATNSKGNLTPAGAADALNNPDSVAVNAAGDVFVTDRDNDRIVEFLPRVPVTVTTSPASATVGRGGTAVFRAAATGNPAPSVQWEAEAPGATSFTPIPGATSDTLVIRHVTATQSGTQYKAVFTNTVVLPGAGLASGSTLADTVSTAAATLTVTP